MDDLYLEFENIIDAKIAYFLKYHSGKTFSVQAIKDLEAIKQKLQVQSKQGAFQYKGIEEHYGAFGND